MPGDLLLPLFIVTLIANAFLVAAAIRSLRSDPSRSGRGFDAIRPRPSAAPAMSAARGGPEPADQAPADQAPADEAPADPPLIESPSSPPVASAIAPSAGGGPAATGDRRRPRKPPEPPPPEPSPSKPLPSGQPPRPVKRRRAAATAPPERAGTEPPAAPEPPSGLDPRDPSPSEPRKRSRRRFSLPPLNEDHDKVSRSIESFLTGVDGAGPDAASDVPTTEEDLANPGAELIDVGGPEASVLTVAMVALVGLPDAPPADSTKRRRTTSGQSNDAGETALAMVERTLRGAARGSDVVKIWARGIFRIDLPATGAFAARVYLRRVRATLEPMLEAANPSLRLVVATATVLDEPLEVAIRQVERRLRAALDAEGVADDEPDRAQGPRAAAD